MDEKIWAAVVDLETTGLDANEDIPLEIGVALINVDGNILADTEFLIHDETSEWKEKVAHGQRHPFVGPMHEKSGLWADLDNREVSHIHWGSRYVVDQYLCDFLDENEVTVGTVPMLGNSIGSLDRPFCIRHLPMFNQTLSYRNIDMSTIKELCKAHNPTLFENLKPIIGTKEDAPHRVMGDIEACIREYRAYVENFFFLEDN